MMDGEGDNVFLIGDNDGDNRVTEGVTVDENLSDA
jgi:hypothetical protein